MVHNRLPIFFGNDHGYSGVWRFCTHYGFGQGFHYNLCLSIYWNLCGIHCKNCAVDFGRWITQKTIQEQHKKITNPLGK